MIRTVADTNIIVSAFLWCGPPRAVLDIARLGTLALFTSAPLMAELEEVLTREKFARRIAEVGSSVDEMLGDYLTLAQLVRPTDPRPAVVRDPDDDHVIACALGAEAEIIVSGDADLLTLGQYRHIAIVSVADLPSFGQKRQRVRLCTDGASWIRAEDPLTDSGRQELRRVRRAGPALHSDVATRRGSGSRARPGR